jgi:hypothetical protein
MPFEAISPPAVPQSTDALMAPSANGYLPQGQVYHPQCHHCYGEVEYSGYDSKDWKRAMSLHVITV